MSDNLTKILITCTVLLFIALCVAGVCLICSMTFLFSGDISKALRLTEMPRLVGPTSELNEAPVGSPTEEPPETKIYKVGDVIQLKDYTIVLNSAEFVNETLKANFTVENQGTGQVNVSDFLEFTARNEDGTSPDQTSFDCGTSISGTVLPGDKLRGDVCWKAPFSNTVKIYYTPELFGTTAVIWKVKQ